MTLGDRPTPSLTATHAAQIIRAALKACFGLNRRAVGRYRFEIAHTVDPIGEESFRLNGPKPYFYTPELIAKTIARVLAQSRQWRRLLTLTASKESES